MSDLLAKADAAVKARHEAGDDHIARLIALLAARIRELEAITEDVEFVGPARAGRRIEHLREKVKGNEDSGPPQPPD